MKQTVRSWGAVMAMALASVALIGCGGGSDGGAAPGVVILDSFGRDVGGDGSSGIGVGDSGADGTAGEGAAIVGGRVEVTDVNGKTVSATTDAQGYYRVKVTGFTQPFVAKVTKTDGKVLHSVNVTPIRVNGFVTVNITGLTDKVASDVAVAGGRAGAAQLTPQIVSANGTAVTQSVAALRTQLAAVIQASGLDVATFDPLAMPFRPNLQGYDKVLENVVVTVGADGKTQVAVSPTFLPTLSGNWQLALDEGGQTLVIGTVPAAGVPSAEQITQASAASLVQQIFSVDASQNGATFTTNGNTVTMTGPGTNYVIVVNSMSFSNYQACGACGVGSTVSYTMNINLTESGTISGVSQPTATFAETYNFRYTRIN